MTRKQIGMLAITLGFTSFFGGMILSLHYDRTASIEPVQQESRIYAQDEHGHVVYLTAAKHRLVNSLIFGGWLLIAGGIVDGNLVRYLNHRSANRLNH
jgi:hypothetical protein